MQNREQIYSNIESLFQGYLKICLSLQTNADYDFGESYKQLKEVAKNLTLESIIEFLMLAKALRLRKKGIATNDFFMFFSSNNNMTETLTRIIGHELYFAETTLNCRINFIIKSDKGHYNAGSLFLNNGSAEVFLVESAADESNLDYFERYFSYNFNKFRVAFITSENNLPLQADRTSCPWYSLIYLGLMAKMSHSQLRDSSHLPTSFLVYSQSLTTLSRLQEKYPAQFQTTFTTNLTTDEPRKISFTDQIKSSTFVLYDDSKTTGPFAKKAQPKLLDFKIKRILSQAKLDMTSTPKRENLSLKYENFANCNQVFFRVAIEELEDEFLKSELLSLYQIQNRFLHDFVNSDKLKFFGFRKFLDAISEFVKINDYKELINLLSGDYEQEFLIVIAEYYQKYSDQPDAMKFSELLALEQHDPHMLRYDIIGMTPPSSPLIFNYKEDFDSRPELIRAANFPMV